MPSLKEIIKDEIRAHGPLTFARFMEFALYHPELGYYCSDKVRIGNTGDYYTSPHVSRAFGKLLAETFVQVRERLNEERCSFVEMGAGEGLFARDFLDSLQRLHPAEYSNCNYVIVERSPSMRERQRQNLGELAARVSWYSAIDDVPGEVSGVFFSNELVDALPFHRVRQDSESLKELYVTVTDDRFTETLGIPSTASISRYFNRIGLMLPNGMTTEVNLSASGWIGAVAERLKRGVVITIDYGYPADEYYSPARGSGTMLCYYRHAASEKPYEHVGEQDITAHVDFTSLALDGGEAGLAPVFFSDQTGFLMESVGWLEKSMRSAGASQEDLEEAGRSIKSAVHPEWMGGALKALVQVKDADITGLWGKHNPPLSPLKLRGD